VNRLAGAASNTPVTGQGRTRLGRGNLHGNPEARRRPAPCTHRASSGQTTSTERDMLSPAATHPSGPSSEPTSIRESTGRPKRAGLDGLKDTPKGGKGRRAGAPRSPRQGAPPVLVHVANHHPLTAGTAVNRVSNRLRLLQGDGIPRPWAADRHGRVVDGHPGGQRHRQASRASQLNRAGPHRWPPAVLAPLGLGTRRAVIKKGGGPKGARAPAAAPSRSTKQSAPGSHSWLKTWPKQAGSSWLPGSSASGNPEGPGEFRAVAGKPAKLSVLDRGSARH